MNPRSNFVSDYWKTYGWICRKAASYHKNLSQIGHHSLKAYFGSWNKIPEADFGLQNQILEAGLHFNGPGATAHNQDSWTIKQDNSGTA